MVALPRGSSVTDAGSTAKRSELFALIVTSTGAGSGLERVIGRVYAWPTRTPLKCTSVADSRSRWFTRSSGDGPSASPLVDGVAIGATGGSLIKVVGGGVWCGRLWVRCGLQCVAQPEAGRRG